MVKIPPRSGRKAPEQPKLGSVKREASEAGLSWPGNVAKHTKVDVKKEEDADEKPNGSSVHGKGPAKDIAPVTKSVYEGWEDGGPNDKCSSFTRKELEAVYPRELIEELKAQNSGGEGKSTSASSNKNESSGMVYIVTDASKETYEATEFSIAGTYSSVEAANLRVLGIFYKRHYEFLVVDADAWSRSSGETEASSSPRYDDQCFHWWIDSDGLLLLWVMVGDLRHRVIAIKQEVGTNGLLGTRHLAFEEN
ncbi:hypothetical protein F4819DRAFT_445883 [Hypoxylon fuscum]|nr:hypothetical protein F4819DRAFT_445883 [Hypoxylon fuscum]